MFLTYLMLVVALCLSAIAAFYSIIGLTAIFAAAVIPVAVMGTILEIAKLTVTVWLHEYWSQCKRAMKVYLVPAVGVLMLITSMGIFGFLSKAHLDQAVPAGDVSAQVSIFDDKIRTQRENIDAARKALRQMDDAVDQQMSRSADEQGAQRAANLRRQQGAERNRLNQDISRAQAEIVKLQEQRAPIAAQARKVEAEVGPIKYIAALIYGDNPDANLLEKAVRWVIIILVVVFDPLAIFMLLAATESYKWEKHGRRDASQEQDEPPTKPVMDRVQALKDRFTQWRTKNGNLDDDATIPKDMAGHTTGNHLDDKPVAPVVGQPQVKDQPRVEYIGDADEEEAPPANQPYLYVSPDIEIDDQEEGESEAVKEAKRRWKADHPGETLKEQRRLLSIGAIEYLPWEDYLATPGSEFGFGTAFPSNAVRGQVWCRTDTLPTTLFKFNGTKWIPLEKANTDIYSYDNQYIQYLIDKVSSGEYDPELLTDAERSQIEQRLKQDL